MSRFTLLNPEQFAGYLQTLNVKREITHIQQHHTFSPSYILFKGRNHEKLQIGMRNFHIQQNGWQDIAQHFTTFPDGKIMTGRSINVAPACIKGNNTGGICIEHLGNFDAGRDEMTDAHRQTIVLMSAILIQHFRLDPESDVLYHHWFHIGTGRRNGGGPIQTNKTCPGTAFFGGNKYEQYKENLMPLIQAEIKYFKTNGAWQSNK